MMNSGNLNFFARNGLLKLPAFHSRARLSAIKARVLDQLKRSCEDGKALRKLPVFQQITRMSSRISVHGAQEALLTPDLLEIISQVGGREPAAIQQLQFLLSPPRQGAWTLGGLNWHVDVKDEVPGHTPGVQAFFLIDDVEPHGGATQALAASHSLKNEGSHSRSRLRSALKSDANLEGVLQEFGLTMLEMSGQVGDVYLMDMRTLHTPSINDSDKIRMMATSRCLMSW